jgi:4-amino-4-deoxy-L-arabinose transferase-like glycosyltransferase
VATGNGPCNPTAASRWPRYSLAALLIATGAFWSAGLSRNGWANNFYAAAVQAGTKSWKALLFGSSDAANSITVDKPPASLWLMELSGRIFGLNSWSLLLPEVLLGVGSVALVYVIVNRQFGPAAGLIAGAVLATTPVATLMFRYDNPDAMLVFVMVAAAWALMRAVETPRVPWMVLCGALIGFGFLAKQLQVLLVTPGLALTFLIAAPLSVRARLGQLLAGVGAIIVAAGWWVALVQLTPASDRPYVGGSADNSFLNLTFGYNGLGRLTGEEHHGRGGPPGGPGGSGEFAGFGGHAGLTRLFAGGSGGQISWLLPAALVFLVVGILLYRKTARTDLARAQYLMWGGWLLGTAAVFSFMSGIFHEYYSVALAPPVAALVGIGVTELWRRRQATWSMLLLAVTVAGTVGWAFVLLRRTPDFVPPLRWVVLAAGVVAAAALVIGAVLPAPTTGRRDIAVAAVLAAAAALAGPLAYSIQTVSTAHNGGLATAGPMVPGTGFPGGPGGHGFRGMFINNASGEVAGLLSHDAEHYTWVAAMNRANNAAAYQLTTGDPVMPIGGFMSSDPSPTLAQFQRYVADKRIHYYIDAPKPDRNGGQEPPSDRGDTESSKIADWVKGHFTPVTVDSVVLYDLTVGAS